MDINKLQKYLWMACLVLSIICLIADIWVCTTDAADSSTYLMAVAFAVAALWAIKRIRSFK